MKRLDEILARKKEIREAVTDKTKNLSLEDLNSLNDELDALVAEEKEIQTRRAIASSIEQRTATDIVEEEVVPDEEGELIDIDNVETRQKMSKEVRSFLKYMMSAGKETRGVTLVNGQAVVPDELNDEIITEMKEVSDVLSYINLKNVKGNLQVGNLTNIEGNDDKDGDEITASGGLTGDISFGSYRTSAKIELGVGLDNSSLASFKELVVSELALALAMKMEKQVMVGTGTNQAEGLFSKTLPAAQNMSVSIADFGHKTLATLKGKIRRPYGKRASFVINTETFHEMIEGMVGLDGHPIYNENTELLLKKPLVISDEAPKNKILYGYGKRYWYNYNMAPQIASSEHEKFSDGLIVHRALAFGDGHVMDTKAFAVLTLTEPANEPSKTPGNTEDTNLEG